MYAVITNLEEKFGTWAKPPGEIEQQKCDNAERMIKAAIDADPVLSKLKISFIRQGSSAAGTNVRSESDMDLALRYNPVFIYGLPAGRSAAEFGIIPATFTQEEFKNMVEKALVAKFGAGVSRGNKAFDIKENTYRVDADVVPAFEHREYTGRVVNGAYEYHSGISIKSDDGKHIVNWPEHALANGRTKHAATGRRYKAVVRILKKLKYEMAEAGFAQTADVSSFMIQSLVWNVPDEAFGNPTYTKDVEMVLRHAWSLLQADASLRGMKEENGMKGLFLPTQAWTPATANDFVLQAWKFCKFN